MDKVKVVTEEGCVYDDTGVNNGYYVIEKGKRRYFWSAEEASYYLRKAKEK